MNLRNQNHPDSSHRNEWAFQPIVTVLIGTIAVLLLEVHFTHSVPLGDVIGRSFLTLIGFASVAAMVIGPLWMVARFFYSKSEINRSRGNMFRARFLGLMSTLVLWVPLWIIAKSLFEGGKARQFQSDGTGPIVVFFLLLAFVTTSFRLWRRLTRSSMILANCALAAGAALCHWLNSTAYIGTYETLHEALGLTTFLLASFSLNSLFHFLLRPRRILAPTVLALLFVSSFATWHLYSLMGAPTYDRQLLFDELVSTRDLVRRVPYRRIANSQLRPFFASERTTMFAKKRREARSLLNDLRQPKELNVILITIDSLRRDHTSLFGYQRKTTPYLEELAKECIVFDDARTPATSSFFSLMSMFSGASAGSIKLERGSDPDLLARALQDRGIQTIGQFNPRVFTARPANWPEPDPTLGFEIALDAIGYSDQILPSIPDKIATLKSPFFLFAHVWDPHFPYRQKEGFVFGDRPIDKFDSEIAFTDNQLGLLMSQLRSEGILENTVVIISADHGEGFDEHGALRHGGPPFEEQCRVPLLIRFPFEVKPRVIPGTISLSSLAPTIVDLLGGRPLADNEAPSLMPVILNLVDPEEHFAVIERPTIRPNTIGDGITALVRGNYKLRIDHSANLALLFDIKADPLEKENLSDLEPEAFHQMSALLEEWENDRRFARRRHLEQSPYRYLRNNVWREKVENTAALAAVVNADHEPHAEAAATLMVDLEFERKISHETGLASFTIKHKNDRCLALQDLVAAAKSGKPFTKAMRFFDSDNVEDRRRAALALMFCTDRKYARDLARQRSILEIDPQCQADLLSALVATGDNVDFAKLLSMAENQSGDEQNRLINAIMTRKDEDLGDIIKEKLNDPSSTIAPMMIENLGRFDGPVRRRIVESLLRLSDRSKRSMAMKALKYFPGSPWHGRLLCKVVVHDRDPKLRAAAAELLIQYPGNEAIEAILTALAIHRDSSLFLGKLVTKHKPHHWDVWNAKEHHAFSKLIVGQDLPVSFDVGNRANPYPRRLFITVSWFTRAAGQDEKVIVRDQSGKTIFTAPHTSQTEQFCIDFDIKKDAIVPPLSISVHAKDRPNGKHLGTVVSTLIRLHSPLELWPVDAPSLTEIGILQRFQGDWQTTINSHDLCFLPPEGGGIFLGPIPEDKDQLEIGFQTPTQPCTLLVNIGDERIGEFKLKGDGLHQTLRLMDIASKFDKNKPSCVTFRLVDAAMNDVTFTNVQETFALRFAIFK